VTQGSKVRECSKRPEAGDLQGFLKGHGSGENFPVYRLQGVIGEGAFIPAGEPIENLAFTIGFVEPRFMCAFDIAFIYNVFLSLFFHVQELVF